VDDANGFTPCTDQSEINTYINDIVALFESDERVYAYAYSDGLGLGDVWPTVKNGQLRWVLLVAQHGGVRIDRED
jgi:hypothetical protein